MKFFISLFLIISSVAITIDAQTVKETTNDDAARRAMQVGHTMQPERVYLHFDNSAYYLGETMWFKAYVSYGTNDRITTPSKVLYVELVAPEGYVVETKKYKIDERGCCNGEFELNPLLLSGYYEVRAYTRYMLNWGSEAVFSRVFPIFDKVNGNNWDFKNLLDRKRGFTRNGEWISAELPDTELKFYPEGGNLVAGLPATVAYELRGNDGEPINSTVTIYENGKVLLTTKPQHMGKGKFSFTPKSGAKYTAQATAKSESGKEKVFKFDLPETEDEGVAITASEEGDSIIFTLRNNATEEEEIAFGILYRGAIGYYKKFSNSEKEKRIAIKVNELPEGVNKAIVFKGDIPLAERCIFVMHDTMQKSDRSTVKLDIKSNNAGLEDVMPDAHAKITLDISREDGEPIPPTADLSITVSDAAGSVNTSWSYNMYSYMLLGSELKGYIPDAAQYFDTANKNRKEQLDLLMLTNGWTAYDWKQLTKERLYNLQPIERGITLKGSFFRKNISGLKQGEENNDGLIPQKNNLTRFDIAYDNKQISTTTFRTDSIGEFIIETKDFYGKRIAALSPQTALKQNDNIKYTFALDRYFSPAFRLYDYWERNTRKPVDENEKRVMDSLIQINPFAYLLSSVEVVSKAKESSKSRPPHSEMRFDFLDEWEYAQDITYLRDFNTYKDNIYLEAEKEIKERLQELSNEISYEEMEDTLQKSGYISSDIVASPSGIINMGNMLDNYQMKYIGYMRYGAVGDTCSSPNFPISETYRHALNAADIVSSAMKRHNYNWAYWVQLMVVLGEYDSKLVPRPDDEYMHGNGDAEKMMNFKEFIIRSDLKTREQFENTLNYWTPKARKLDIMTPVQKFYIGFLSQHYVSNKPGIDGFPSSHNFMRDLSVDIQTGRSQPYNPNYVACFIPYTAEESESRTGIVPDLANSYGTRRYTSIQGYSESKQFYSPDYSTAKPTEKKDYRRTLLWEPNLQAGADGKLQIVLHNSSYCDALNVEITGRDGQTYYSNDAVTTTRINKHQKEVVQKIETADEKKEEEYTAEPMDPEMEKACKKQHEMAIVYYNQKRYRNAIMLWAELAKFSYTPALRSIAQCYTDGTGVSKNLEQALRFYENAAKAGDAGSQYEVAIMYRNGIGCTANESLAQEWMQRASKNNEPRAMTYIARRLIAEKGESAFAEANSLMISVGESGTAEGLYEYARFITEYPNAQQATGTGTPVDCLRKAAEMGLQEAQIAIMNHEYDAQNHKEAYRWARTLSLAGRHEGTKRMADCYNLGLGVKRDKKLAKDLYRTAASNGNKEAADILKSL